MERIIEYTTRHEPEAPAVLEGNRPPADWPQAGKVDVQGLVVRYRPSLPPVLKGLTFCIQPREKVRRMANHSAAYCRLHRNAGNFKERPQEKTEWVANCYCVR